MKRRMQPSSLLPVRGGNDFHKARFHHNRHNRDDDGYEEQTSDRESPALSGRRPALLASRKKMRPSVTILFLSGILLLVFYYRHHDETPSSSSSESFSSSPWTSITSGRRELRRPPPLPYTPRLPPASEYSVYTDWEWPAIHLVHTRFMQEQGNLSALGAARWALFRVFCLPTMVRQTAGRSFLWIIKTDPNIDVDLLRAITDELRPYPNFYLVASNRNFRINSQFPGAWRDGAEASDLARSVVYSGNRTLIEIAMALRERLPVLETRLDADDGLHLEYLQRIQSMAAESFDERRRPELKWRYWCSRRHIEWHWEDDEPRKQPRRANAEDGAEFDTLLARERAEYGAVAAVQHERLCVTPGITAGFPVGVSADEVPIHAHHKLLTNIRNTPVDEACGARVASECLQFVEDFAFEAVRARTPTSAGMLDIIVDDDEAVKTPWLTYALHDMLRRSFGISRTHLRWINRYLSTHILEIARDNLMGQCTTGHSCKEMAKRSLESIIAYRNISVSNI